MTTVIIYDFVILDPMPVSSVNTV